MGKMHHKMLVIFLRNPKFKTSPIDEGSIFLNSVKSSLVPYDPNNNIYYSFRQLSSTVYPLKKDITKNNPIFEAQKFLKAQKISQKCISRDGKVGEIAYYYYFETFPHNNTKVKAISQ